MRAPSTRRHWRALAATARSLVDTGWPVVPGAWWAPLRQRHRCDSPACRATGLHPAPVGCHDGAVCAPGQADLARYTVRDAAEVATRWAFRPYTVLVVTGLVVDALDLPAPLGERLLTAMTALRSPTVATVGGGRTSVFLAAGPAVDPSRAAGWNRAGVVCHQRGSWTVAAPSVVDGRPVSWAPHPPWPSRQLPDADEVLPLLDQLVRRAHRRTPTPTSSR